MADLFLSAHQLAPRLYSVGGKIYPISIRDQMLRGRLLVDRLLEVGVVRKYDWDRPLVILGAGAAGVSAALRALEKEVVVQVFEREDREVCWLQEGCKTRWVCPTTYDFPVDHWAEAIYPYPPIAGSVPPPLLKWNAAWANDAARSWQLAFQQAENGSLGVLRYRKKTAWDGSVQPDPPNPNQPFITVGLDDFDPVTKQVTPWKKQDAAAVLLAFGFGQEKRYLRPPYRPPNPVPPKGPSWGFGFWQSDPFDKPDLDLQGISPEVLISGSGDGALQDFLRLVLDPQKCRTVQQLYDRLFTGGLLSADMLCRMHGAADFAQRALTWGHGNHHDHPTLLRLHRAYKYVVRELLRSPDLGRELANRLDDLLRPEPVAIHWVYECNHFSICYGLNRFLALLVLKHLLHKKVTWLKCYPKCRVKTIQGLRGHGCNHNADACHGHPHEIQLERINCCAEAKTARRQPQPFGANVLVLRHGIDLTDVIAHLGRDLTPPQFRQMLPYGLLD